MATEEHTLSQDNQTRTMRGAYQMLIEAAKQFRLNDDSGHSTMCEMHADGLADIIALLPEPAPLANN